MLWFREKLRGRREGMGLKEVAGLRMRRRDLLQVMVDSYIVVPVVSWLVRKSRRMGEAVREFCERRAC